MSTRSTRRRSARNRDAQSPSSDEEQSHVANGAVTMNGNGSAHAAAPVASAASASDDEERENIFIFWPNIIGTPRLLPMRRRPTRTAMVN